MITLTTEQAQEIEEIVEHLLVEHPTARHHKACVEALSIIREARAQEQAEQEPVAYRYDQTHIFVKPSFRTANDRVVDCPKSWVEVPLYAAPVRTKDLTPEDIEAVIDEWYWRQDGEHIYKDLCHAVIAADREKNK